MKKINSQEILLLTNTRFAKSMFCKTNGDINKRTSNSDSLQEACWNGLLPELLPEITKTSISENRLSLWRISRRNTFIHIELSMAPAAFEGVYSIEPEVCALLTNDN